MTEAPTPERVALARRLYRERMPVRAILATAGIGSLGTLYRCLDGDFPDGTGVKPAPIARRHAGVHHHHAAAHRFAEKADERSQFRADACRNRR